MSSYRILQLLLYAYYVLYAGFGVGFFLTLIAFVQTRRPRLLSEMMLLLCAFVYFVAVGRYAFVPSYIRDSIETRFALTALAAALVIHYFVVSLEMWVQWRILRKRDA